MGTTNYGSQEISFDYKAPGKSQEFNKLNYEILPVGIYKGGLLTRIDTVTVQISQLTCFIEDTVNDVAVRISTSTTINTTVAPSTPYLIIRFGWSNVENNYADIIAVDYASIDPKDIIIGRCAYDIGNNLLSTFDYTRRTISSLQNVDDHSTTLKVYPTESPSNTIQVSAGEVLILNNPFTFAGGTSSVISDTIDGRIDLVFINDSGVLEILEGTDSSSPVQPDFPSRGYTLAKITRGASETVVRGDQIEMFDFDGTAGGSSAGGSGGSSIEGTAGESIDAGEVVYFGNDGKLYLADNREFAKSIVAGISLETVAPDGLFTIGKIGLVQEYSGLTKGAEYYLGHDGLIITLGSLEYDEYKVHIGTAKEVDTIDAFVQLPEPTRNQDDGNPVGSIKYFSTYKDRSAYGYLPFAFDNAISQANYSALWNEIGHIYNEQHVAAGDVDLSGSSTIFYPTPIPGAYDRVGIPDITFTDSNIDITNDYIDLGISDLTGLKIRRGTAFKFKANSGSTLPTTSPQIDEETTYYILNVSGTNWRVFNNENYCVENSTSGRIDFTDSGSGTFRLTQEGIVLDDAFQGFWIYTQLNDTNVTGTGSQSISAKQGEAGHETVATHFGPNTDNTNGTPRTTNETRPKTNYSFGYIKAENVTSAGEPISALREVIGWTQFGTITNASINIQHNLVSGNLPDLNIQMYVSDTGSDSDSILLLNIIKDQVASTSSDKIYGANLINVDTSNFTLKTGADGILKLSGTGGLTAISGTAYYKFIITKPNLINTVFDVSTMPKTYDLTTGDITVTLPEISGVMQTKSIYWTNGGTYKLSLAVTDSATIGGLTASTWEGEGEGHIVLESDGQNWQVREYEDSKDDTNNFWIKYANGTMEQYGSEIITFSSTSQASVTITYDKPFVGINPFILQGGSQITGVTWLSPIRADTGTELTTAIIGLMTNGIDVSGTSFSTAWKAIGRWRA